MTANQINYFKAREDLRSHLAQEQISGEANRINLIRSGIDARNADTNLLLAQIKQFESEETQRSNLAKEAETRRSNLAKESETQRHNIAEEVELNRSNVESENIRWQNLFETQRSNVEAESQNWTRIGETVRSNKANEALENFRNTETHRANVVRESQAEAQLWHDSAKRQEDARHNMVMEQIEAEKAYRSANQGAVREATNFFGKVASIALPFLAG